MISNNNECHENKAFYFFDIYEIPHHMNINGYEKIVYSSKNIKLLIIFFHILFEEICFYLGLEMSF